MTVLLYDMLNKLRQVDEKIKELSNKKNTPPKGLKESQEKLKSSESKLRSKSIEAEAASRKSKHVHDVFNEESSKLLRAEEKLSQVKNSKEYQAALKEVNQLKKTVLNLNEQYQTANTETEKMMAVMKEHEKELKEAIKNYELILVQIKDNTNLIDAELTDITETKNRILSEIPDDIKKRYLRVYEIKNGIGVAVINGERCGACNMSLPKQFCNQVVKADQVYHCPSCQRLIIYINKE